MGSTPRGYPWPNPGTQPMREQLVNLAVAVDADTAGIDQKYAAAVGNVDTKYASAVNDVANINAFDERATSNVTVTTARLDLPGAVHRLPANVGALVTAIFDVQCDAWNGLCTFAGGLRVFRLSDGAELFVPTGPALYAAGVVNGRGPATMTWRIPAQTVGSAIQATCIKTAPSNAGYVVNSTTSRLIVQRLRTGSSGGA